MQRGSVRPRHRARRGGGTDGNAGHAAASRSPARRRADEEVDEAHAPRSTRVAERHEKLTEDVDDLLDEIDDVLEENAEEFVRGYVQKGGQ